MYKKQQDGPRIAPGYRLEYFRMSIKIEVCIISKVFSGQHSETLLLSQRLVPNSDYETERVTAKFSETGQADGALLS